MTSPELSASPAPGPVDIAPLGPVSAALEEDIRTWVRRQGIVVWLDADAHYDAFVDRLVEARAAGELSYEVKAFRGSFLELMMALEDLTGGAEKPHLLVHLPGFNEDTVRSTPLYELYRAGVRYRKALETLVSEAATGRVKPEEITAFSGRGELTLERADAWLRDVLESNEGGLAAQLRAISPSALLDDLLGKGFISGQLANPAAVDTLWEHVAVSLAVPPAWRGASLGGGEGDSSAARPTDVAFAIASWALSVEYVDDLRRAPKVPRLIGIAELPKGIHEACHDLAAHLRDRHPDFYRRTADETETLLGEEVAGAKAEDLGRIDTFRFEEEKVLEAAVVALADERWGIAAEYADARVDGQSFWLRRDPARQSAWQLVAAGAALGEAVTLAGPKLGASDHHEVIDRYRDAGAPVDAAHRRLEQLRLKLLSPQLPEFEALRARLDELREVWRGWADAWAIDFNSLCQREGFLPPAELQQRELFEQVVRPAAAEGTTAYFVIDAFRFEMGAELHRAIARTPATTPKLEARYAELPTNTEIGMNVLAPVATNGRLKAIVKDGVFKGFSTGEFTVRDPETRRKAMHARVAGSTCPWLTLSEVLARDTTRLKQTVAQANLVVVHSEEIDKAGEKGVGTAIFDTVMQQIRSAWQLLRDAGVKRFVFTSDHGFLLMDGRTTPAHPHGRKIDPKRRHVVSPIAADHDGEVRVPLADLGYDGVTDHVMFPRTTAPFDTGKRTRTFVHGGNSLQERIIPVLTVTHRAATGGNTLKYRVEATALDDVAGMHCLKARVEVVNDQATLDFGSVAEVELGLRVVDIPDVRVELCQTRGQAKLRSGVLVAAVGETFEVFFRLTGRTDARALVALHHPSRAIELAEAGPDRRFAVALGPAKAEDEPEPDSAAPPSAPPAASSWLDELPEAGVRDVFRHIQAHGVCVESEATKMLGGARALRRFSARFEEYAAKAPFEARIEVVSGVKRYVREGGT